MLPRLVDVFLLYYFLLVVSPYPPRFYVALDNVRSLTIHAFDLSTLALSETASVSM